jgi:hypothetical protein
VTERLQAITRHLAWGRAAAAVVVALAILLGLGRSAARADTRSCGWIAQISADQLNVLYPDAAATYWLARVPIPPGAHVEVHGVFPHARYTSIITYTPQTQAIDGIHDSQIVPDPGSSNPFLPGASRTATGRSYTVSIVNAQAPAVARAPNTVYNANADGSKSAIVANAATFLLRIYEGDLGSGVAGGEPLPDITLVLSSGQRITYPQCPSTNLPNLGLTQTIANAGPGSPSPVTTGLSTTNPPVWHKFTNAGTSVVTGATDNQVTGTSLYPLLSTATDSLLPSGGFAENVDNKYIYSFFGVEFGQVLVLHARAPTFPATRDGEAVMGTGQVRYWSLCTNSQTTAFYACRQDDQVPIDAQGYYTIAISSAAARPLNATEACGVAWLPSGPAPQSALIMRNMLPDPSFAQAIQNAQPGKEAQAMGAYYPTGHYYATTADFERTGCHPPASAVGSAPSSSVQGGCTARPGFVLRVHRPRHGVVRSLAVYINSHRVLSRRGRHINRVLDLGSRLNRPGRYIVQVVVRYSTGGSLVSTRIYSGCTKTAPSLHGRRTRA